MQQLFSPIRLGALALPNRIIMAPLTRGRATRDHVPTPIMADYYAQRASAGLIITEATGISQEGLGWPYAPGIWNADQIAAWKPIVAGVHGQGGRIICQLWHMGRVVHPDFLGGDRPVSASALTAPALANTYEGKKPFVEPRALDEDEMPRLIGDYIRAAQNAMQAGFDGVQIHAANGYLIDQFLRETSNMRTDRYGDSIDNRIRLLAEIASGVAGAVGAERIGVRLSPNEPLKGVDDSNPDALFGTAAEALRRIGIAFIELREPGPEGTFSKATRPPVAPAIQAAFGGPIVLNSDYFADGAEAAIAEGRADAISFGRPFIANPDLPERFRRGAPLNQDDKDSWYTQGAEGYTTYPGIS